MKSKSQSTAAKSARPRGDRGYPPVKLRLSLLILVLLELFGGAQFEPNTRRFVGLTPHIRYNFATGTRWVPFVDAGAGVTATTIGPPDLSGTFEFNLQPGTWVLWFLKDNLALSLEARYVHWSCGGLHSPNLGLNGVTGLVGLTYFF